MREGSDGGGWQERQLEFFALDGFAFSKGRQACVVRICQPCQTVCQSSVFANPFEGKEGLVGCQGRIALPLADGIQITQFAQFFNSKGKVVEDGRFKFFIGCGKWHMKEGARGAQDQVLGWNGI